MRTVITRPPQVFRILIIDDQLCSDTECNDKFGCPAKNVRDVVNKYLVSLVASVCPKIPVEIIYAKDPDEGISLWLDQIFDLTLVDSDFSKSNTSPKTDSDKRSFLDLNLQFSGAYLFRFLKAMAQSGDNPKIRFGCEIALWTGLGLDGREDRAEELLSILAPDSAGDTILFIPKKEDEINEWKEVIKTKLWEDVKTSDYFKVTVKTIEDCLQSMKESNPVLNSELEIEPECIIERIKRLYPVVCPEDFMNWCGLDGYVSTACLFKSEDNTICLSDEWKSGGVLLSPLLRKHGNEQPNEEDALALCALSIKNELQKPLAPPPPKKTVRKERIIAAATPLTGCSAVNEDDAIAMLTKKIQALLDGPFGKVVLKTVYLDYEDQWEGFGWPRLQAQEKGHITRCLRSTKYPRTLWNTGKTSNETFAPVTLNKFLSAFAKENKAYCQRVIVSLGSKYPLDNKDQEKSIKDRENAINGEGLKNIWSRLFNNVFMEIDETDYPLVEINVRHYLRGCIAANLSGNEYLSPSEIKADFTTGDYKKVDEEFRTWLNILDDVARVHNKKLILKLPYRSDIFHFISIIDDCRKKRGQDSSIAGITLINAFKSAEGDTEGGAKFSPAWYGVPNSWIDNDKTFAGKKYQMSGELLAASRNELLPEIVEFANSNPNLEIHISGGIVDQNGIDFCLDKAPNIYVQIGTWSLMSLNLGKNVLDDLAVMPPASGNGRPRVTSNCKRCAPCSVKCPNDAFISRAGKQSLIDAVKCTNCMECIKQCQCHNIENPIERATMSRDVRNKHRMAFCIHELCDGCGRCSRTFYCDAFLDRRGKDLPPIIEPRNCTGCGLCVQTCPHGAIQLFEPKDFVLLVGNGDDKKSGALATAHKFLFSEEIPHLVFPECDETEIRNCPLLQKPVEEDKLLYPADILDLNREKDLRDLRKEVDARLKSLRKNK